MVTENKFARIMRNTGPARFFVPMGIILIVVGILMLVLIPIILLKQPLKLLLLQSVQDRPTKIRSMTWQ